MTPLFDDTSPAAERILVEACRRMTPAQRVLRACALGEALQILEEAETGRRHPDDDTRRIRLRVAARRIPADLMRRAFGWDPEAEGF